jgi:hypothetical protein
MAKKSGRAKGKAARKVAAPKVEKFSAGEQVRVVAGDYGNTCGNVVSQDGGTVSVQLAGDKEPRQFDAGNLVRGGPLHRA